VPSTRVDAIKFLETQWSHITQNKIKGILAELRLKAFLRVNECQFAAGGWIVIPGNCSLTRKPTESKICLLPLSSSFELRTSEVNRTLTLAQVQAYNSFR
jgi:hypothetical protein